MKLKTLWQSSKPALLGFIISALYSTNNLAIDSPSMANETASSGIEHFYTGGWEFFVGGGVSVFDCNGDHYPEIYLAGGTSKGQLYLNHSRQGEALFFKKAAPSPLAIDSVTGAYPIDIDSDGILDLVLLRLGENKLLKGKGNCEFEDANKRWQFDGGNAWTTAFSATWEANQRWPTLAFGNYVDRSLPGSPFGTCHNTDLYRPDQENIYRHKQALSPGYCALSLLFSDWNRSGKASLRIANDRQYYRGGHEQLWQLAENQAPREYTESDGWRQQQLWGMGIASADINHDGRPDYYVTSMTDNILSVLDLGNQPNSYRPDKDLPPTFKSIARERKVTAHRPFTGDSILPSTAWHAQFDDINNDSYQDLLVVKGNVEAMTDFALKDPNNLFLGTPSGEFFESADKSNMLSFLRGRGGSMADFNLDGLLDVIVVNREAPTELWRNLGRQPTRTNHNDSEAKLTSSPMGNWLGLQLRQEGNNPEAIGAFIEVRIADRTQVKEITIGGGHAGGKSGWHHFGLGVAERAQARVQWPDGKWGPWVRLFANQYVRIARGEPQGKIWLPPKQSLAIKEAGDQ